MSGPGCEGHPPKQAPAHTCVPGSHSWNEASEVSQCACLCDQTIPVCVYSALFACVFVLGKFTLIPVLWHWDCSKLFLSLTVFTYVSSGHSPVLSFHTCSTMSENVCMKCVLTSVVRLFCSLHIFCKGKRNIIEYVCVLIPQQHWFACRKHSNHWIFLALSWP